jgi:hypothetical protein
MMFPADDAIIANFMKLRLLCAISLQQIAPLAHFFQSLCELARQHFQH